MLGKGGNKIKTGKAIVNQKELPWEMMCLTILL